MKKFITMAFCLCLLLPGMGNAFASTQSEPLRVVSTIFPPYDFVRQIAGDRVELTMLLSPGSESHSFEPSPRDILTIQNCDLFLYIGGETDAWVDRILDSMDTSRMQVLSLLDMVQAVPEETVEGMTAHDHAHDAAENPSAAQDRPLSQWTGQWASILSLLQDVSSEEIAVWESNFSTLSIDGDTVAVQTSDGQTYSARYHSQGFAASETEDGVSIWYQFQRVDDVLEMPLYIAINDHHVDEGHAHGAHEHASQDEPSELAHYHMRYGNESFDALLSMDGWSPTFFPADADSGTVRETLQAYARDHAEMDEHVWTAPHNARTIVAALTKALCTLDPANAPSYQQNADVYDASLAELDDAFRAVVDAAQTKTIVFGDRFPFRYFADAYGLTYYAAFPGCATETEASAATVAFLIDTVAEAQIPVVFTIEFSNGKLADVICESTGATKRLMHSCHNVSREDFENAVGYLDLMWQNMDVLKEALSL